MRKLFLIGITLVTLSSCYKDPQNKTIEGNGVEVEFLFEKDGVKVYRFLDGGEHHYFTSRGETMTTQSSGKTNYEENIQ
jgi:hypothetical protein